MYAIFQTGGKQYKAEKGDIVFVEKLALEPGKTVSFDALLISDGDDVMIGTPIVEGAKVKAKVLEHGKEKKVVVFKYKPKENYRKKQGHRQPFTKIEITGITAKGKSDEKPSAKSAAAVKPAAKKPAEGTTVKAKAAAKPAAKKPAEGTTVKAKAAAKPEAKKPAEGTAVKAKAAAKPAAKKPAEGTAAKAKAAAKPAAKKPAAKKPVAKKPASAAKKETE